MVEAPHHGTREAAREFIAQMAAGAGTHAAVAQAYAETGNDVGLLYAARCLNAYIRALAAGIEELERCRGVESYRRAAAEIGPATEAGR